MFLEGTKKYTFVVELTGIGENEEEAWLDATEAFDQDPGLAKNRRVKNEEQDLYLNQGCSLSHPNYGPSA
jgi:hypothetical protein